MSGTRDETRTWLRGLAYVMGLCLAVLSLNFKVLAGHERLTPHHDNRLEGYPLRVEAARQWREGRVALWNPYKRAGMPLAADTSSGALYPAIFPFCWRRVGLGTGRSST